MLGLIDTPGQAASLGVLESCVSATAEGQESLLGSALVLVFYCGPRWALESTQENNMRAGVGTNIAVRQSSVSATFVAGVCVTGVAMNLVAFAATWGPWLFY